MSYYKVGVAVMVRLSTYVEATSTKEAREIAEEKVTEEAIGSDDWQMDMFDAEPVYAYIRRDYHDPKWHSDRWQKVWVRHDPYAH